MTDTYLSGNGGSGPGYYVLTALEDPIINGKMLLYVTEELSIWFLEHLEAEDDHEEAARRWEAKRDAENVGYPWHPARARGLGISFTPKQDGDIDE